MKSAIYVRHSKSSWENPRLADIDRPLNKRGLRDCIFMAEKMVDTIQIDQILCSPSVRTTMTMEAFKEAFQLSDSQIIFDRNLYHASSSYLEEILFQVSNEVNNVMIFTHNPGITMFANQYSNYPIDNVPTTGIFKLNYGIDDWTKAGSVQPEMEFFVYPKLYK